MKNIITLTLITCSVLLCQAQTAPSAASAGSIKDSNTPVSLFTGTSSVSIPLFTATAKNGASVPVGLSYNASGIKVNEVAGPAGLGWQLYAGGRITRVTKGLPDEYADMVDDPTNITHAKLKAILDGTRDSERDLFYFNFPGGGGKFIFSGGFHSLSTEQVWCSSQFANETACLTDCHNDCAGEPNEEQCQQNCVSECNQNWLPRYQCNTEDFYYTDFHTLPYADLTIHYDFNGFVTGVWTITTPDGTKYHFNAHEETNSNEKDPGQSYDPANAYEYVSTWLLTSIEYPNTTDVITFEYTNPIDVTTETEEFKTYATAANVGTSRTLGFESTQATIYQTIIGTRYLSKILFAKGSIDFSYQSREDLSGGQRLTDVTLKDKAGNAVSKYSLNQSYFSSVGSYYQGNSLANCANGECKRLKLESVHKDGGLVRAFTYRNEQEIHGSNPNYYNLPPRNSLYYDHWGYNNAGGFSSNYNQYPRIIDGTIQERPGVVFQLPSGTDREPNDYAQANILTRVDYPTDGYTQFEYENHTNAGGVRIASVKTFNGEQTMVAGSDYTYELPAVAPKPSYQVMYDPGTTDRLLVYQRSKASVMDLNGSSVGYGKVTVTNLMGQGKVEHYFNTDYRTYDTAPTKGYYSVGDNGALTNYGATIDPNQAPFSTYSLLYYDRGNYSHIKTFDATSNLVSERSYTYDPINLTPDESAQNLALEIKRELGAGTDVYVSQYDIKARKFRLASVTNTFYDNGGSMSTTTSYSYDDTLPTFPDTVITSKSDGYATKSITTYNDGIPVQTVNQIQLPSYSEFKTNGVTKRDFRMHGNLRVLDKVSSLPLDVPITNGSWTTNDLLTTVEMISYSTDGLLLKQRVLDGITTEYEYDAEGYLTKTKIYPGTAYERITEYFYDPLVGISKIKDTNSREMSYEYDSRNRLKLTRNNEGNIISRNRYVSDSDVTNLTAEIGITYHSSGSFEDVPHSFFLENVHCLFGTCTYSWNWGDGSSSGNVTSASHTYANSGDYTVAVTITNPEYESPVTISRSITILANITPTWLVSGISGPTLIDRNNPAEIYTANITEGDHTCGNVSYTYLWQSRLSGNTGSWSTHSGSGNSESIDLSDAHSLAPGERYDIKVTVSDGCGATYYKTKSVDIDTEGGAH